MGVQALSEPCHNRSAGQWYHFPEVLGHERTAADTKMKKLIKQPGFKRWIEHSLQQRENILAVSNQGTLLHYREGDRDLVVKTAMGSGLVYRLRHRTLMREFEAYKRMKGLAGVPRCYGLVDERYLVIDYIRGRPYRQASWNDRDRWFKEFLAVLQSFHSRGVSHGDLKSKGNILVTEDEKPCVIDFGTSFVSKPGFHPVNNWMFEHARRMDINAWVKHKYHGRYEDIAGEDLERLDYSFIEYWVRKFSGRPTHTIPRRSRR
jgi:serine/threonine protein kinase